MADLVRVLHTLTTDEAAEIVEALIERQVALVWRAGDKKRVLRTGLTQKENTLLLLLSEIGEVLEVDLVRWIEQKNVSRYRGNVLRPGHKDRLWEYRAPDIVRKFMQRMTLESSLALCISRSR